jgi:hypothetical protein
MRLIHDPTVTPQFPCLEDYGTSSVLEEWIKLSRHTQILRHGWSSSHDRIRGLVEKINLGMAEAGNSWVSKIFWAGKFLKFPAKFVQDAWVARGGVEYLMRRFSFSRLCHVSVLEWPVERLSVVSHNYWPDVEKSRHFFGFSRYVSSLPFFKPRRRLIFSARL